MSSGSAVAAGVADGASGAQAAEFDGAAARRRTRIARRVDRRCSIFTASSRVASATAAKKAERSESVMIVRKRHRPSAVATAELLPQRSSSR